MLKAYKRKRTQGFSPWQGFLILIIIAFAFGLKIVDALRPERAPTADIPAVSYQDVVQTPEQQAGLEDGDSELEDAKNINSQNPANDPQVPELNPDIAAEQLVTLPEEFNLAVPFTSQAPNGNWDALHEDACEEASFLMVVEFYNGREAGKLDPVYADPKLFEMVDLQTRLGMGYSISAQQSVEVIQQYYNLKATIVNDPTVDQIKQLIAEGKPVIVPAAGRELGNPFFTGEGPLYHMLVLRGYTKDTFIANDPGTRNGENYTYSIDTIMNALGDWNNGDPYTGDKLIVYIEPF